MKTNNHDLADGISVIMPTFQRPQDLPRALDSLIAQEHVDLAIEIVVADNDPKGSAQNVVEEYASKSSIPIVYIHSPLPGVSNARNTAMSIARGRYIAWLDDDQEAAPNWLSMLIRTAQKHKAQLVFCPSPPVMEVSTHLDEEYEKFFARKAPVDGIIEEFFGCGNSLLDLKNVVLPSPVFDPIANESGGEDDMLFSHLQSKGARIAWTSETYVYEHVPAKRATPSYVRKRSFAWGQGPTEIAYDHNKKVDIVKWMAIGTLQIGAYIVPFIVSTVFKTKRQIHWTSKFWQGAGKVFWLRSLRPKLYGQTAAANKAREFAHLASKQLQS